jgi:PAS domain S-box-containing protein
MIYEPLHSVLEGLGGIIAVILATFLLNRKREQQDGRLVLVALGLISMGLLDAFHAASAPGDGFILLRSASGLAGGFWFALICLPRAVAAAARFRRSVPWVVGAIAGLFGVWTFLAPGSLPVMLRGDAFTPSAAAINVIAAALFLPAAARLSLDFRRQRRSEIYLLAWMAGLFGIAHAIFPFMGLGGQGWMLFHVVRLAAYVLALGFTLHQYQRTVSDLNSELTQHQEDKDRLLAAEARYRTLFEQSPDGVLVIDAFTRVPVDFNEKAHQQLGYTREEFANLRINDYEVLETPADTQARIDRLMGGSLEQFETQHRTKEGEVRHVQVTTQKLMLGSRPVLHCIFRDITDAKRAEANLRAADAQLHEQAALVRLGEMAAVVAHEVKNPLAGIRGVLQVIGGHLPPGSRDVAVIGDVIARLDSLDELMKDLLLFARPPQLRAAAVDVLVLARQAASLVKQDPTAHDVHVAVEGPSAVVLADAKLLQIVLLNLLLNAVQAVEGRGSVQLRISGNHDDCRISIIDSGPGIPQAIRDRIFVPFFTTKSRGTGLGLPTAKRLIDAHKGRISVECPAGGGTVVTVVLPATLHTETGGGDR